MRFFFKTTINNTRSTTITEPDKDHIQRDISPYSKLLRCVKNKHFKLSQRYTDNTYSSQRDISKTYSTPSSVALFLLSQSLNKHPYPKPSTKGKEVNISISSAKNTQLQNMAKRLNSNHSNLHNETLTSNSSNPSSSSPPPQCSPTNSSTHEQILNLK